MNAVRGVMTFFLLLILALVYLGWRWSAALPSPKLEGARVALVLTGAVSIAGGTLIWRAKPRRFP